MRLVSKVWQISACMTNYWTTLFSWREIFGTFGYFYTPYRPHNFTCDRRKSALSNWTISFNRCILIHFSGDSLNEISWLNLLFRYLYQNISSYNEVHFCQTPTPGESWELTLLSRGHKKNNNKNEPHLNSPRRGCRMVSNFCMGS